MSVDMDALIEKARLFQHGEDWFEENGKVIEAPEFIHRLTDALVQLRGERDEALATIERAKTQAEKWFRGVGYRVSGEHDTWDSWHEGRCDAADELHEILSTAPTDALNAVKAEALREAAEVMLDPKRGLPFDSQYDLATVHAWTQEYADDIEKEQD